MAHTQEQTTVIVFGTMHLEPKEYPAYAERLERIIEEIAPDIICSELSPEQLEGTATCNSKPEQRDVVIPTARRLGIPIVPIQAATADASNWETRYKTANQSLRSQEPHRYYLEYSDHLAKKEAELWGNQMISADYIENVQLNEYHVFSEARDVVENELMPELAEMMSEWNESFLHKILETIETNRGQRILIITGLWHKYWLWNRLSLCDNVSLHNLQSFRKVGGAN